MQDHDRATAAPRAWILAAAVVLTAATAINMRGWMNGDLLPAGDFAGYAAEIEYVRAALARDGSLPIWLPDRFAGTTRFMSNVKEVAAFPLAAGFGTVAGTKLMFGLMKITAALAMFLVFRMLFAAPAAGLVAAYSYVFCSAANIQTAGGGHLDVAISFALFPLILLATVALLRDRRGSGAVVLGVLLAVQLAVHFYQAMSCAVMIGLLLALRPWRRTPGEDPLTDVAQLKRWGTLVALAIGVFAAFAGSQLVWLATDLRNHALHSPEEIASGLERYLEHSPLLYVNRGDWLGVGGGDRLYGERRYLGLVALSFCMIGWFWARRRFDFRRWYQLLLLLLLFQYGMAIGPQTLVGQIASGLGLSTVLPLRIALTIAAIGAAAWGAVLVRRRSRHVELAFGVAFILIYASHSLFGLLNDQLSLVRGMRAPGHFFDLAPFAFAGLFGLSLAACERALASHRARWALCGAAGILIILDFWQSTAAFRQGTPVGELRRIERELAGASGSDGRRVAMYPWYALPVGSLAVATAEVPAAWTWIPWQSGRYWKSYMEAALYWTDPELPAEEREALQRFGDPLARLGRVGWLLEDFDRVPRIHVAHAWVLRAEHPRFTLWEQRETFPYAWGTHRWAVWLGGTPATEATSVAAAAMRGVVVIDESDEDSLSEAALVVCESPHAPRGARCRRDGTPQELMASLVESLDRTQPVPVSHERPTPDRIVLTADVGGESAVVFVSESFHPWWEAKVDGDSAPVLRAAMTFMAVHIGPGRHTIELRLRRPFTVAVADRVNAAAWFLLAIGLAAFSVQTLRRRWDRAPAGV